jgi:hypothetical protein
MKYLVSWRWIRAVCNPHYQEGRMYQDCIYENVRCTEKSCPLLLGLRKEPQ